MPSVADFLKPPFLMQVYDIEGHGAPILVCEAYSAPPIGAIVTFMDDEPIGFKVVSVTISGETRARSIENPLGSPYVQVMAKRFKGNSEAEAPTE